MYIKPCPEKIRAGRRKQGLSAYALAMKAGLDKKAIYRIESKESLRTHSLRAQAIADALGCPVEELFDAPGKKGKTACAMTVWPTRRDGTGQRPPGGRILPRIGIQPAQNGPLKGN